MLKAILFLLAVSVTYEASLMSYNISLPNSSYTITGITYIQNTDWVQIAISGPSGGFTRLYNLTNTTATQIASQPIENGTNSTYASKLINLPNSYLVAATVEPNFDSSRTFLSIWDTYTFQKVVTINNIGQVQYPWINDRVMIIAANPLKSTGKASIHIFNVVTGALIDQISTDFQNITSISSASNSLVIAGKKAQYPSLNFIEVCDAFTHRIRYSYNYSTPVTSMSTFFRTYESQRYFGSQVLIVWEALANATNNQVMVLDTDSGLFTNVTMPVAEVIQQCWAGDSYEASFVCQTHNMHRSVFQFFKNYAYVNSQSPTVLVSGQIFSFFKSVFLDIAFHVENKKFYFATSSTIVVWTLE